MIILVESRCITTNTVTKISAKLGNAIGNEPFEFKGPKKASHLMNGNTKFAKIGLNTIDSIYLVIS